MRSESSDDREGGENPMKNLQKAASTALRAGGRSLKDAAFNRQFDQAAYHFFVRYNGENPVLSLHDFMARFERAVLFETLVRANGSQAETASILRVRKQTLSWKVRKQRILITKKIIKEPI